ncbi:MAG: DUF5989 family protein [Planctomycetaceae bacterium]|jgi:hypothetical protein|nr:DUF5989 family protein [Planctomycetaceae bacterium]
MNDDVTANDDSSAEGVDETTTTTETSPDTATEFARAAEAPEMGLVAEFWDFLVHNKAWWLTPIVLVLVLVFVLVWFAGTPFAPFIYGA